MRQDTFFFFFFKSQGIEPENIPKAAFTFSTTKVSQHTDKGALDVSKTRSLDTNVSASTNLEIKMKTLMLLKTLLKKIFVGLRYTLEKLLSY